MGRIKGHYEWDDDDLTPGQKKEGGLHQNLFDGQGKLKGSARFVPDNSNDSEPLVVTETVYVTVEQRRRSREDEALQQAIADLLAYWIDRGIARARPIAAQWWRDNAWPAIDTRRAKMLERLARHKAKNKSGAVEPTAVDELSQDPGEPSAKTRLRMSRAEAQARFLAALAAQAYSDEQLRLVTSADIVDGEGFAKLQQLLAELPPDQVRILIEAMVTNPAMLGDESLAQLASVLGRRALRDTAGLDARKTDDHGAGANARTSFD